MGNDNNNDAKKELGALIGKWIVESGRDGRTAYNQTTLSADIGIKPSFLSSIINGHELCPPERLTQIWLKLNLDNDEYQKALDLLMKAKLKGIYSPNNNHDCLKLCEGMKPMDVTFMGEYKKLPSDDKKEMWIKLEELQDLRKKNRGLEKNDRHTKTA